MHSGKLWHATLSHVIHAIFFTISAVALILHYPSQIWRCLCISFSLLQLFLQPCTPMRLFVGIWVCPSPGLVNMKQVPIVFYFACAEFSWNRCVDFIYFNLYHTLPPLQRVNKPVALQWIGCLHLSMRTYSHYATLFAFVLTSTKITPAS